MKLAMMLRPSSITATAWKPMRLLKSMTAATKMKRASSEPMMP